MKQQALAMAAKYETGFEQHRRPTRRDEFLDTMNRIVPRADLCVVSNRTSRSEVMAASRGLTKSAGRAFTALAWANIYLSRNRLMAQMPP